MARLKHKFKVFNTKYTLDGTPIKMVWQPDDFIYASGEQHGAWGENCLHHLFEPIMPEHLQKFADYGIKLNIIDREIKLTAATVRWFDEYSREGTIRLADGTCKWINLEYQPDVPSPSAGSSVMVYGMSEYDGNAVVLYIIGDRK